MEYNEDGVPFLAAHKARRLQPEHMKCMTVLGIDRNG